MVILNLDVLKEIYVSVNIDFFNINRISIVHFVIIHVIHAQRTITLVVHHVNQQILEYDQEIRVFVTKTIMKLSINKFVKNVIIHVCIVMDLNLTNASNVLSRIEEFLTLSTIPVYVRLGFMMMVIHFVYHVTKVVAPVIKLRVLHVRHVNQLIIDYFQKVNVFVILVIFKLILT